MNMYRTCPTDEIRAEAKRLKTRGYRIIVDGEQLSFSRWSKRASRVYEEIYSDHLPQIYRNMLGELAIDWDRQA